MAIRLNDCRPVVLGLRGPVLTQADRVALKAIRPVGIILFARNIETPEQVRALCADAGDFLPEIGGVGGRLIAVDQEGGRVQRLAFNGPNPAAYVFGDWLDDEDGQVAAQAERACMLNAVSLAADLREVGATWVMAPCVDLAWPETHRIIGDRAYSGNAQTVAELAAAHLTGTALGGCLPCLKHAPGHGRATTDSHAELPVVTAMRAELITADWFPYRALADTVPFIMTAHIAYPALQGRSGVPATYDAALLKHLRSAWGFEGLWLADDLGMQALSGTYPERVQAALEGGCDLLLCCFSKLVHGMAGTVFDEVNFAALMDDIDHVPVLGTRALTVLEQVVLPPVPLAEDVSAARAELQLLMAGRVQTP